MVFFRNRIIDLFAVFIKDWLVILINTFYGGLMPKTKIVAIC